MKLSLDGIKDKQGWLSAGIALPRFDIEKTRAQTAAAPEWLHFGAGNIFRGFIGSIAQKLLNIDEIKTGIIAAEGFDHDIIDMIYSPFDCLTLNVLMGKEPGLNAEVLAGIASGIKASDRDALTRIADSPSLKMISFTITEKGYAVRGADNEILNIVKNDIESGPDGSLKHTMSIVAALLYSRYKSVNAPLAAVSMDNCSHNGEKLKNGVMTVAEGWVKNKLAEPAFIEYINDSISFPWSMIDKITPRPDDKVRMLLEDVGVENMKPVITGKGTYIAPFVNAEIPQYLVIEDDFPNGRPPLEKAGVYMTTRETVNKAETMKVTTCLNPLHTALAVFGCLLGYKTIWEEMRDPDLKKLVDTIAADGMKVVIDPKIIDPDSFVKEVIEERLPNPNIPDAPQRIATDTSQKIPIRYGETIKAYMRSAALDSASLKAIPTVIAGWLRYLTATDDNGDTFEPSPDPLLGALGEKLSSVRLGSPKSADGVLKDILSNEALFGVNLYDAGLGEKTEKLFASMLTGKGAVRNVLKEL